MVKREGNDSGNVVHILLIPRELKITPYRFQVENQERHEWKLIQDSGPGDRLITITPTKKLFLFTHFR